MTAKRPAPRRWTSAWPPWKSASPTRRPPRPPPRRSPPPAARLDRSGRGLQVGPPDAAGRRLRRRRTGLRRLCRGLPRQRQGPGGPLLAGRDPVRARGLWRRRRQLSGRGARLAADQLGARRGAEAVALAGGPEEARRRLQDPGRAGQALSQGPDSGHLEGGDGRPASRPSARLGASLIPRCHDPILSPLGRVEGRMGRARCAIRMIDMRGPPSPARGEGRDLPRLHRRPRPPPAPRRRRAPGGRLLRRRRQPGPADPDPGLGPGPWPRRGQPDRRSPAEPRQRRLDRRRGRQGPRPGRRGPAPWPGPGPSRPPACPPPPAPPATPCWPPPPAPPGRASCCWATPPTTWPRPP
jgi:hypothetical protein